MTSPSPHHRKVSNFNTPHTMAAPFILSLFLTPFLFITPLNAAYNVVSFGAKSGGQTDSTQAFLKAWAAACRSTSPTTIHVPKGSFLVKAAVFKGPCKSEIKILIDGTIVAPDYRSMGNSGYWILFIQVDQLAIFGGTLDAKGAAYWACRRSGKSCPVGARVRNVDCKIHVNIVYHFISFHYIVNFEVRDEY